MLSVYTEDEYAEGFARVVNSRAISFEKEHLKKYHGCPFVVGVDIFPIDRFAVTEEEKNIQIKLLKMLYEFMKDKDFVKEDFTTELKQIEELCGIKFDREKNIKNQLLKLVDTICQLYNSGEGRMTEFVNYMSNEKYVFSPEWYNEQKWMRFETIQIPVPLEYDKILRVMYGDYEIPVFNGADHDYPFYKQQEKILREYID